MNPLKILCIALGFVFVGLGALGALLPILPTTPFLLLAAFFFARGSKRFDRWFHATKLYQNYLDSYMRHRCMTRKTKIMICALASSMMVLSLILVDILWVRLLLVALIGLLFFYFRFRIKTVSPEEDAALKAADRAEREVQAREPISLRETVEEVRVMHEELFEEASSSLKRDVPEEEG
ncbi:MAG: YbaN family protein [Coriobacteriales bacterium]|jgi:uncharacterized membrane protein YbaN (DUF454 family)|nr:YbaN family protein [Coriobacteriales bacterium]